MLTISPPSARLLQASRCGILLRDGQIIRPIPWVFCLRDSQRPSFHCIKREYIQVLRLHEDFPEPQVAAAVRDAVKRRLIGFDAVKHLLLARIEKRPARLDLTRYPHLPQPFVAATRSADYATLLAGGAGHG